jgi:hypothetical protein
MSLADTIIAMADAGCSPEQMASVARKFKDQEDAAAAEKRAKDAARQRKSRSNRHAMSHDVTVTPRDICDPSPSLSPSSSSPPITPLITTPPISPPSENARGARLLAVQAAFDAFWRRWPHKVGKPAAEKAFAKVSGEIEAILIGIDRYIRDKPPDRPWLNPATFLNQRRWEDAPAETFQASRQEPAKKISAVTQAIMNLEAQIHETQTTRDRQALRQIPVNGELIPGGFGLEDPGLPGNLKRFHG